MQSNYKLPSPQTKGNRSVEEAIFNRRSRRSFQDREITAEQLSQILWAAYGITKPNDAYPNLRGGLRSAPSAGATYPLEIYVLIGKVKDIEPGLYKYISKEHSIIKIIDEDLRKVLCVAAFNQEMISNAPAVLLYCAVYSRSTQRYGSRGRDRYVCMDIGHSAENVYLQAEALYLGTCAVGAFDDMEVKKVLKLPKDEVPLYIMPFGYYINESEY